MQACPSPPPSPGFLFCFRLRPFKKTEKRKKKNVEEKRKKLYDLTADMKQ
jgi:hypothetical protein